MPLLLFLLLLGAPVAPPSAPPASGPVHVTLAAFGTTIDIEARGLPSDTARQAIQKAAAEIAEVDRLTDSTRADSGLAALNAAAGKTVQTVDPRLDDRAYPRTGFLLLVGEAHGPLGRDLYALWGVRSPVPSSPPPERVSLLLEPFRL